MPSRIFEQGLLHALTAHVAGDGGILTLAGDLIDLVDIDDADLCFLHIKVRCLDELEENVLHILTHIASLRQGGGIRDRKRNTEHLGQRLGQQGLADTRGAQQQDVGLLQLHVRAFAAQDALIVVVDRDGQHTLGLVLPDDILIQALFDLCRGLDVDRQAIGCLNAGPACTAAARAAAALVIRLVREQVRTQADALAADIDARANDHPLHFVLMLAAKTANQIFFVFISAGIVVCHSRFSLSWVYCVPHGFSGER